MEIRRERGSRCMMSVKGGTDCRFFVVLETLDKFFAVLDVYKIPLKAQIGRLAKSKK